MGLLAAVPSLARSEINYFVIDHQYLTNGQACGAANAPESPAERRSTAVGPRPGTHLDKEIMTAAGAGGEVRKGAVVQLMNAA